MVPVGEENPYAVRVVSDILESNGSSSMATVCAGTLALMDAGVKIKKPVSGIAMGLITDAKTGKYAVLSDILGDEDHLGDMDFKVTGTKDGITATQMDIKVDGLSYEVLANALEQAKQGRMHILGKILETISEPRAELKPFVPRIEQIVIPQEFIGAVIGPGGKVIQEIQKTTGTTITITEKDEKGYVDIFGENKEALEAAMAVSKGSWRFRKSAKFTGERSFDRRFRRICGDHAGQRRSVAHLRNRQQTFRNDGRNRPEGGRYDRSQTDRC